MAKEHKKEQDCCCEGHCCGEKHDDLKGAEEVLDKKTTIASKESNAGGKNETVDKDVYKRLLADFENFKKRTEKEKENTFLFVERMVLTDFLGVVDDFERLQKDETIDTKTHEGIGLVYKKMLALLTKFNVSKIDLKIGDVFDDSIAESISSRDVDDEKKNNTIAEKYEDAYKIGNIVMRYAKVVVYKYKAK
jgi:molecular chaperone GrpE